MKKLCILAALLTATTAAHAGNSISFEIEGHKIHIEAPRIATCSSCIKVSAPGLSGSGFGFKASNPTVDDDNDIAERSEPSLTKTDPRPRRSRRLPPQRNGQAVATAPADQPASTRRIRNAPRRPSTSTTTSAPQRESHRRLTSGARCTGAAAPARRSRPRSPTTPLGVWATEENKGNVRVEPCGPNLCGYAVKTGEKILINMKPSDNKWTGRIYDPDSGRNYDSTIAMKGPNVLRVQGCAFGGMFCGGQTWKRVS